MRGYKRVQLIEKLRSYEIQEAGDEKVALKMPSIALRNSSMTLKGRFAIPIGKLAQHALAIVEDNQSSRAPGDRKDSAIGLTQDPPAAPTPFLGDDHDHQRGT